MKSPTITSPAMTQMGMILGTAAYMSPDRLAAGPSTSGPTSGRSAACSDGVTPDRQRAARRCHAMPKTACCDVNRPFIEPPTTATDSADVVNLYWARA
jgi:hypothetical protein